MTGGVIYVSSSFIEIDPGCEIIAEKKRDPHITRVPRSGYFSSLLLSNQKARTVFLCFVQFSNGLF